MEAIVTVVGFLGAGKTTLLKKIVEEYLENKWKPFLILNDYENASVDAQGFFNLLDKKQMRALSGSCICCSGVTELRDQVNKIPPREKGVTLIEANGTTDAVSLMGFLGVGLEKHFLPPIQIAVVDVRHWQKRISNNELEANQVQVSSVIVLNYIDKVSTERVVEVEKSLRTFNERAIISHWDQLDIMSLLKMSPSQNEAQKMKHETAHWSSCSVDLPDPINSDRLSRIIDTIPASILRVKGCTRVDDNEHYSHFERTPSGEVTVKNYIGAPITGAKLLTIGPGSDPELLVDLIGNE